MPELENPETKQTELSSSILAGYLTPKDLAHALGVSERTIARWHHFPEGSPRVAIGRKVYYRLESVSAWVASCERPEPHSGRARDGPRSIHQASRSRRSGTILALLRDRAAATIEAKRLVA
jgi:hypothetical protein